MTISKHKRERIAELRSLGWTYERIREAVGVSDHTARQIAKQELGTEYSDHFLCPVCGSEFFRISNQRYCSVDCRKHASNLRKRFYKLVRQLAGVR